MERGEVIFSLGKVPFCKKDDAKCSNLHSYLFTKTALTAADFSCSHVLLLLPITQNITLSGSGNTATGLHVIFRDVTLFTTGLYGCEASADPSFHTQLTRKHLTVLGECGWPQKSCCRNRALRKRSIAFAVKPESRPVIVGEYKGGTGPRSRAGDTLKMKCYVNSTFPSANVTWFVNGKMVRDILVAAR